MTAYRIKNWDKYQHYKTRNPPWIKLHCEILTSEDWVMLDDASRVLAIACMLMASKDDDGYIPDKPAYVQRVCYLNSKPDFLPLVECGFLQVVDIIERRASAKTNPLADASAKPECARPETETETETEKRREEKISIPLPADAGNGGADACNEQNKKPETWKTKPDPLLKYPKLMDAYPKLEKRILELHPHAKLPTPGTKQYFDSRQTLSRLVSIDKHTEDDVIETMKWVIHKEEPGRDGFLWRDQFQSIAGLRNISDGMTKFAKMNKAMMRSAPKMTEEERRAQETNDYCARISAEREAQERAWWAEKERAAKNGN